MRSSLFLALAASSVALVAQAPAQAKTLADTYAAEDKAINALLKEYKSKEAIAKLEALIPAEAPKYAKPTLDELKAAYGAKTQEILASMGNYQGLVGLNMLHANAYFADGQWEKAKATYEKALGVAKLNEAEFKVAVQPVRELWSGLAKAAEEFKTKNAEQAKGLEAKAQRVAEEEEWLNWYRKNLQVHEGNIGAAKKINDFFDQNQTTLGKYVSICAGNLGNVEKTIQTQANEIKTFNEEQTKKEQAKKKTAKPVEGNKAWVEAVLNKAENVTGINGVKSQVEFLNRLLVLEPESKTAQKVIENLKAGKEPFAKEPKAAAKPAGKAPKGKKG